MNAPTPQAARPTDAAPAAEALTGAQIVVRLLERQGVTTVSGIPGGAILPFYDALSASEKIRHVLARHEQGAGFIAQGWYQQGMRILDVRDPMNIKQVGYFFAGLDLLG